MYNWIALDPNASYNFGWTNPTNYFFTANDALVPVLQAETHKLISFYPLAFVPTVDSFNLVGLQSLIPDYNYLVDSGGRWISDYVPAFYRSYPFQRHQAEDGRLVLCIDKNSNLINRIGENNDLQPLFDIDGQPSAALMPIINFLKTCHSDAATTQNQVNLLHKHDLIQLWDIEYDYVAEPDLPVQIQKVDGLFKIDEEALTKLSGDVLQELTSSGALKLAYAQIFSQARLEDVKNRMAGTTPDFTDFGVPETPSLVIDQDSDMIKFT